MKKQVSISLKIISPVIIITIASIAALLIIMFSMMQKTSDVLAKENAVSQVESFKQSIQDMMQIPKFVSISLASTIMSQMNDGDLKRENYIRLINDTVKNLVSESPILFGIGVIFEPNILGADADYVNSANQAIAAITTDTGRFVPYGYFDGNMFAQTQGAATSAEVETSGWYKTSKATKQPYFTEPYAFEIPGINKTELMMSYSYPMIFNGKFVGMIVCDVLLTEIDNILDGFSVYGGYSNFISPDGLEVYCRNKAHLLKSVKVNVANPLFAETVFKTIKSKETEELIWHSGVLNAQAVSIFMPVNFGDDSSRTWVVQGTYGINISRAAVNRVIFVNIGIAFLIVVLLICMLIVIVRRYAITPFREMTMFFGILKQGDYSIVPPENRLKQNDEIGVIANSVSSMMETTVATLDLIKKLINTLTKYSKNMLKDAKTVENQVKDLSGSVSNIVEQAENQAVKAHNSKQAVEQITDGVKILDESILMQANAMTQSSSAVEQMLANVGSIDKNVKKISGRYKELTEVTSSGLQKQEQVGNLVREIASFSETLSSTNKMISDISRQTNLLAMNAAIEAAHAGEAGKGFAVVADEIRKLAESSSEQSKIVSSQLKQIRGKVDEIVVTSSDSKAAFDTIVEEISAVSDLLLEVGKALDEQNEGSNQVLVGLKQINKVTGAVSDNGKKIKDLSNTVLSEMNELSQISSEVKENISDIKKGMEKIDQAAGNVSNAIASSDTKTEEALAAVAKFKLPQTGQEE